MDEKEMSRILKIAIKTGKCIIGSKQVAQSVKGSKLVILASSPSHVSSRITELCKLNSVPLMIYKGSSVKLGQLCGKPFKISAIAIKSAGEADLTGLLKDSLTN
ncbi:MAG: 50S ribosomal protein L30e [Nitrososphaerales archaeon]|nr:50S ribosomal protein L30e [Nitrososphaerales archaeon]